MKTDLKKFRSELKEYFENAAFSYMHRKTLDQMKSVFPEMTKREIRRGVEYLHEFEDMAITAGGRGHEGYFLPDLNNIFEVEMAKKYYMRRRSTALTILKTSRPFLKLYNNDEQLLLFKEYENAVYGKSHE